MTKYVCYYLDGDAQEHCKMFPCWQDFRAFLKSGQFTYFYGWVALKIIGKTYPERKAYFRKQVKKLRDIPSEAFELDWREEEELRHWLGLNADRFGMKKELGI